MCREVLVSGLREFLAEVKVGMPVTRLAKWKTGFQMTALSMLLMSRVGIIHIGDSYIPVWGVLGEILLWVAGVLTFMTGYDYFQKSLDYVRSVEKGKPAEKAKKAEPKKVSVKKAASGKESVKEDKKESAAGVKTAQKKTAPKKKAAAKKKTVKKAAVKKAAVK